MIDIEKYSESILPITFNANWRCPNADRKNKRLSSCCVFVTACSTIRVSPIMPSAVWFGVKRRQASGRAQRLCAAWLAGLAKFADVNMATTLTCWLAVCFGPAQPPKSPQLLHPTCAKWCRAKESSPREKRAATCRDITWALVEALDNGQRQFEGSVEPSRNPQIGFLAKAYDVP